MNMGSGRLFVCVFLATSWLVVGCSTQEGTQPIEYKGPLKEAEDVEMFYTENDLVKVKLIETVLSGILLQK